MGAFNRMDLDIRAMINKGYTIEEVYIYYKDYISLEDVVRIHSEETV
jgi:hypothetical protein